MAMRRLLSSFLMTSLLLIPTISHGTMIVRNFEPARHNRFYTGSDKNFVGEAYDFSGVGINNLGHWATLITDNAFLSSTHYHPGTGETVTFHASNDLATPGYTYTVTGGVRIATTDLWLGWFDTSVTVDASIERYSVPMRPSAYDYLGLMLYNYGASHRVGLNVLDELGILSLGSSTGLVSWYDYDNNDIPSVGGDETMLQSGDSGAPSFTVFNSSLTLLGIHWALTRIPEGSLDTFIPEYFDEINSALAARGQTLSFVPLPTPEPDSIQYLLFALVGLWHNRKRNLRSTGNPYP